MIDTPISIINLSSISALGTNQKDIWQNYQNEKNYFSKLKFNNTEYFVGTLSVDSKNIIVKIQNENSNYKQLDKSVLYTLYCGRQLIQKLQWNDLSNIGINIGSSRGATGLFEYHYGYFLEKQKVSPYTSPSTTLGNISSWLAHDLQVKGPNFSHSVTCSTGFHALLNGISWLLSGLSKQFIVGASEAPLTPFTIAQMESLKAYSKENDCYPCKSFDLEKTKNTLVLGEGSGLIALEKGKSKDAIAHITGIGYGLEPLLHGASLSKNAKNAQKSMSMAISKSKAPIDIIVMHSPGTIKGDCAEYQAIKEVFKNNIPTLTSNKWKLGHTFGASGVLSLEFAIHMLQNQKFIPIPYLKRTSYPRNIKNILVNAMGFGGNCVSILISNSN